MKADTKSGAIYFIAEDKSYSYNELVKHLRQAVGRAALPLYVPSWLVRLLAYGSENIMRLFGKRPMFTVEKANEILANWEISTKKAELELGYKLRIPFPEGAAETVCWYREEGKL
jgi:nucleoside-diphosphate-sugar epimerase